MNALSNVGMTLDVIDDQLARLRKCLQQGSMTQLPGQMSSSVTSMAHCQTKFSHFLQQAKAQMRIEALATASRMSR